MRIALLSPTLTILLAATTLGVGTSYWTQTTEADFKSGSLDGVVASNLGDVKLSRAIKTLLEQDPRVSAVNVLAQGPDGAIYAGTGPNAELLVIRDGKVTVAATIPNAVAIISIIAQKDGAILLGTGGEAGRVLKLDKPDAKPRVLFEAEGVQYIWGLAQTPDGNLYVATGPHGQLYEIKPDESKKMVLQTQESNLLSLISDGKDLLYVGTDPHGLVYRVNRKTGESFVLYNAAEAEVSALALDREGNLFAGTAEAREEATAPAAAPEAGQGGRPEGSGLGVPIPADRPNEPTPPPPPNPNPGQPDPIPKTPRKQSATIQPTIPAPLSLCTQGERDGVRGKTAHRRTIFVSEISPPMDRARVIPIDDPGEPPATADPGSKKKHPHPGPPGAPPPAPGPQPAKPEPGSAPAPAAGPAHPPPVDTTAGAEPRAEGNAIYKITPEGFVSEVFRAPVLILSMIENNGTLLVATGGEEGEVYQVRPAEEETLVLAKVDAKQIMCLLAGNHGDVYLGTANVGSIASMSDGFAPHGAFQSPVLDATQISRFGKMHLHGSLPPDTSITVSTRSGNVKEADDNTWSKWTDEVAASEYVTVTSPTARFLQYRLTLSSANGKSTPVVRDVSVAYQIPNLPPAIKAVKVALAAGDAASGGGGDNSAAGSAGGAHVEPSHHQTIAWEASDPNGDPLTYALYLRPLGETTWILIKEKLTEATWDWDSRTAADGRYQVKVVASDAGANAPGAGRSVSRVSDPFTVDNTPPLVGNVKWKQAGTAIEMTLKVVDRTSTVASLEYCIDSARDWQYAPPVDGIYDSPEEEVALTLGGLSVGQHQITFRATDSQQNRAFENVFVTLKEAAAAAK